MNGGRKQIDATLAAALGLVVFIMGIGVGLGLSEISNPYSTLDYDSAAARIEQNRNTDHTGSAVDFDQFWAVWDAIQERYVDQPVDETQLLYGAIEGLVNGVNDPYSVYFDPTASAEFLGEISGSFNGIGAEIGIKDKQLTVITPLTDSPAEAAGLQPGDSILAIDGLDTSYISLTAAVELIRGEAGTSVTLMLRREGTDEPFELAVTRDKIHIDSVRWSIIEQDGKQLAHIVLSHFNSDTSLKFQEVINEIVLQQPDGIILDLRNNAGGFLDAAINIASVFVEEGKVVVYEQDGAGNQKPYTASAPTPLQDAETIVIINQGSASAAEILAGALQDHDKGVILGMQSFGKGTVQDLEQFDDGSSLKLTVARWLTPLKDLIDSVGITPDVQVDRTAEDYSSDTDPQLDAAVLYFTDRDSFRSTYQPSNETTNE